VIDRGLEGVMNHCKEVKCRY